MTARTGYETTCKQIQFDFLRFLKFKSAPKHHQTCFDLKNSKTLSLQSFLRKGVSLGYVGRIKT